MEDVEAPIADAIPPTKLDGFIRKKRNGARFEKTKRFVEGFV